MYSRQWGGRSIDALIAWGRNKRSTTSFAVPGGIFLVPAAVTQGTLVEATIGLAPRHAIVSRLEHANKDELFPLDDPRHATPFGVTRLTTGYVVDLVRTSQISLGIGAAIAFNGVAREIEDVYGGSPRSVLGF